MKSAHRFALASLGTLVLAAPLAADSPWKWSGGYGDKAVEVLIVGDIQVHSRRADRRPHH